MTNHDSSNKQQRRTLRRQTKVDGLMGVQAIADALDVSYRTASRILEESAVTRSGLWPQLHHRNKRVVKASVLQAYIDALPCIEDLP